MSFISGTRDAEAVLILIAGLLIVWDLANRAMYAELLDNPGSSPHIGRELRRGKDRRPRRFLATSTQVSLLLIWVLVGSYIIFVAPPPPENYISVQILVVVGLFFLGDLARFMKLRFNKVNLNGGDEPEQR